METNESYLEAVMADPSSDAPRHAYADFLDRQGDRNRAEFIRLQCAIAKLPKKSAERRELRERERELLDRYAWDWAQEIGPRVQQWVFRRGFVECVQMSLEVPAEEILFVCSKAPVRHIRNVGQFCELSELLKALPYLDRLTGLEFWGLYAVDNSLMAQLLASEHLRNLRTLILHHDRNGNLIDENVLIEAMNSPFRSNIRRLAVNVDGSWRGPSTGILQAIARSPYLRNLRDLNMSHAGDTGHAPQMDIETVRIIGQSENFAKLRRLDLSSTSFPLKIWDEVLKWPWLKQLKHLRMNYARHVQPPSHKTVARVENLPKYSKAFKQLVREVDWDTEMISPGWEGTCWEGISWNDRPRRLLLGMNNFIRDSKYDDLESDYRALCLQLTDDERTGEVDRLSFNDFSQSLAESLNQSLKVLHAKNGKCLFLRHRPSVWDVKFHVHDQCSEATKPYEENGYNDPIAEISGPRFDAAAQIHIQHGDQAGLPNGPSLYLLARTISAVGRCLKQSNVTVPVYFSCMKVVFRMRT